MKKKITHIFILASFLQFSLLAQIPDKPNPPRLVNDYAEVLTQGQQAQLENALSNFARSTSTQIVVVTVDDLQGYEANMYATELGHKWGVGQAEHDNGLVILVKEKQSETDRGQAYIATGYGLEDVIPDAIANRVVDIEMIPHFKQNDYYGGIVAAVNVLAEIASGKYTAQEYNQRAQGNTEGGLGGLIFIIIFFVVFGLLGRSRRRRHYSPGHNLPLWLTLFALGSSGSSRSGGSFGSFSSGGGSFGGFGGGGFGGGGAGGSW